MNRHAVLLASAKVRPDCEAEFAAWQARQSAAILIFSGVIGTDMIPPPSDRPGSAWTDIINFDSEENLAAWQQS
jgi:antibiotic biosynthesis monooxygenase (ABM) superfamily enzyme